MDLIRVGLAIVAYSVQIERGADIETVEGWHGYTLLSA